MITKNIIDEYKKCLDDRKKKADNINYLYRSCQAMPVDNYSQQVIFSSLMNQQCCSNLEKTLKKSNEDFEKKLKLKLEKDSLFDKFYNSNIGYNIYWMCIYIFIFILLSEICIFILK